MSLAAIKITAVIFSLIIFLVAVGMMGARFNWLPEWQRKILHIGLGCISLSFPWLFDEFWQVLAVCAIATGILLLLRLVPQLRNSVGSAVFGVNRSSLGELLFMCSIVLLFRAHQGNVVLYVIPIAILTLSDACAALIGTHYGEKMFDVADGTKSWEGTLAFATVTFLLVLVLLSALTTLPWLALFMIALTFAVLGALIEAVSWHGLDNLSVPLTAYLFLNTFLYQDGLQLFYQLFVLAAVVALGLFVGPKSRLNTHALMSGVIALYFFGVVGSIIWILAPVIVFFFHIALVKIYDDEKYYTVDAVLSVMSGGFFWLVIERLFDIPYDYFFFTLALAIHLQIIILVRLEEQLRKKTKPLVVLAASLIAGGLILSTGFAYYGVDEQLLLLQLFALAIMFFGGVAVPVDWDRFSRSRWTTEAALALGGSASALVPVWLMRVI